METDSRDIALIYSEHDILVLEDYGSSQLVVEVLYDYYPWSRIPKLRFRRTIRQVNWISKLLASVEASESPKKYWYWAGLSAISAVVNNKVYLDKFLYKLYPNTYVILVGKSGIRKGPPVAMAKALVSEVDNTRIFSGRASIQAIVSELKMAITKPGSGAPITDAIGFMPISEFASFLVEDPAALTILTDLYDGHYNADWTNITKGGGKEILKNVCLTLLGASNEVHFKDVIPDNALGGGFVARTCIIHAEKKAGSNPLTERPANIADIPELAKYLHTLSRIKGQFVWSREGKEVYDRWYESFDKSGLEDQTGTLDRLHDHILKAAMLISLARAPDLTLTEPDIKEAIFACQEFIPGARKMAMTSGGKSAAAPGTAVFIRELLSRKEDGYSCTRKEMGQKHWNYFDMFELDKIAESLKMQSAIKEELRMVNGVRECVYILEPRVVKNFESMERPE